MVNVSHDATGVKTLVDGLPNPPGCSRAGAPTGLLPGPSRDLGCRPAEYFPVSRIPGCDAAGSQVSAAGVSPVSWYSSMNLSRRST